LATDRLAGAVLAYAAALAISTVASVGAAVRMAGTGRRDWVPRWRQWVEILRIGAQTHLGNVLKFFQYRFDVVLIGILLDKRQVGLYVVGLSLAELPLRVPDAVGLVLLPKLARAGEGDGKRELTQTVSRHVLFVTFLSSAGLFLLVPWFINAVFGSQFQEAYGPARLLIPGGLALALWKVLAQDLIARGRPNAYSLSAFFSLVTMVVGCLLLVPWLGLAGGALASSLAYLTASATLFVAYRRLSGARLRDCVVMRRADFALYGDGLARVRALMARRPVRPPSRGPE
jgi:O-antigen/teichoic acid export membrane protein